MPRKSKRSQVASQRWQRFHDIDRVSTEQADGIPQSSGEVNYRAQTEKPCSTQSGEQNVCASRSQASLKYGQSRNQQCTCNSLTFLAFLYESEHITRADLDRVLDKGDVMYREVRKTVRDHAHLTTDELPKEVPARRHTQIFDKSQLSRYAASCRYELKPVVFCDVNPSDAIPATESPSTTPSVTTTVINDDTSAPQMNTDVHENTECDMETEPEPLIDFSQCSVTLTGPESLAPEINTTVSNDTSQNVSILMEIQAHQPGQISMNSVTEETQETQSNLTQPFITIPVASDNVIHDIATKLSKLSKERKLKFKRRLMRSEKTSQEKKDKNSKEREKYAKNETYKAKKKSYSSKNYSVNPEIQTKKRKKITTKYRESTDFRLKQKDYMNKKYRENVEFRGRRKEYITKNYRENVEFKGRQKEYITKNYRENVEFKGRQKEYFRKKYSVDINFRQRKRSYDNHRYANDEIFRNRHRQLMRQMMRDRQTMITRPVGDDEESERLKRAKEKLAPLNQLLNETQTESMSFQQLLSVCDLTADEYEKHMNVMSQSSNIILKHSVKMSKRMYRITADNQMLLQRPES
ncbi:uncharacterized protein LOC117832690 isoform X1 [Xyrichtys novacula]|uniref:Uncharacterized protein LOC117832690 isoform X1 n=1 Tax=Xyrichtys novacula TaxID=13765 RepID=A0AAV1HM90_XYRNO|nr:uncharacterized protein LOC117832690 isoform X1 [Xyrichtys novacula]